MHLKNIFLTPLEEKSIKTEFIKFNELGHIDSDILPQLVSLNSIDGLATLYSCQGHKETNQSPYLVLKCSEEMYNPLSEALFKLKEVTIEWNETVEYDIFGIPTRLEVIILRSKTNSFFKKLASYLVD